MGTRASWGQASSSGQTWPQPGQCLCSLSGPPWPPGHPWEGWPPGTKGGRGPPGEALQREAPAPPHPAPTSGLAEGRGALAPTWWGTGPELSQQPPAWTPPGCGPRWEGCGGVSPQLNPPSLCPQGMRGLEGTAGLPGPPGPRVGTTCSVSPTHTSEVSWCNRPTRWPGRPRCPGPVPS